MQEYLIPFILTAVISLILTSLLRRYLITKKYFDQPGGRHIHKNPIPRFGGAAVFVSWLAVIVFYLFTNPQKLQFSGENIFGLDKNLLGMILGAVILFVVGLMDDLKNLKPHVKLFWIFVAALLVALFGIKIWWFSNPFGNLIVLGTWSYIFVIGWIILLVNVTNWLDGIDGLATGVVLIASLVLFLLSISQNVNQPATALLLAIFAGSLIGFLPYNFNPAKIFLGDSGSLFLGYILAIAAIISGGKVATAFLVFGLPILDAFWVIGRRLINKKSPMKADRGHLHHRLLDAGMSQRQIVVLYYFISAFFGYLALKNSTSGKFEASFWLILLMIMLGLVLVVSKFIKEKKQIKNCKE